MQASSDLSILDFDIPFSFIFVANGAMDLLVVIVIVASVTWEVLLVAIPAIIASTYVQVYRVLYLFVSYLQIIYLSSPLNSGANFYLFVVLYLGRVII